MNRKPWKYQKAQGHHHVLIGDEVLDVDTEANARLIAKVPEMWNLILKLSKILPEAKKIVKELSNGKN